MYLSFYGLKGKPFSLLPDPAFLYLSPQHETAVTLLDYGLEHQAGFCVVTGKAGTGKTILLRRLLNRIGDDVAVGLITNTHRSFGELLRWILHAFSLDDAGGSRARLHQIFIDYLIAQYAKNRRTLLIVDEAQNMSVAALEELRMLSNINSEKDLLLQVILVGQPPLRDILRRPELEQFAQRVAVDYHLEPLNVMETAGYIRHRLRVAGGESELFTDDACEAAHAHTGGIPRLINLLGDLALVYGYAGQAAVVTAELIEQIVREREQHGALPVLTAAADELTAQRFSTMGTQAVVATQGRRTGFSRRASDVPRMPKTVENLAPPPKSDNLARAHVQAVKIVPSVMKQESVAVVEPKPLPAKAEDAPTISREIVAVDIGKPAPPMPVTPDPSTGREDRDSQAASLTVPFTFGPARRLPAGKPARFRNIVPGAAAVLALSVVALGWYFVDRTGMLKTLVSKNPAPFVVMAPSSMSRPASAPASATSPTAAAQPVVAAPATPEQEKIAAEEARLKQAQRERDAALAVAEAATLERESLRQAALAKQRALTAQHEAALARERERANQLARAAEMAILQAAEKPVEPKPTGPAVSLPPVETPKKVETVSAPVATVSPAVTAVPPAAVNPPARATAVNKGDPGSGKNSAFNANPCKGASARFLSTCE